ncbi:MAG: M81 family metallopeptidase, partial [Acetobacteraceae bacterium]|nr:M81 family metallopeptidase [Acetobacteraceae bacterium]
SPAGPVERAAFERISAMIVADLSDAMRAGPIDGVYLDLHGAMLAEDFPDGEAELLRRVRAVVGPDIPITASLDPHANVTARMVELADALAPFRTYPHVDMKNAGARAARLLLDRIARGRPFARAFVALDFWIPLTSQCTMMPPMAPAMAERAKLAARHGVAELAFCFGFPYADFDGCQPSIAAYADTEAQANEAAAAMKAWLDAHETTFQLDVKAADQAVAEAIRIAAAATRPVVLADTQDNPGGGGHGDTTGLLGELIRQGAQGAVLAIINDAESAAACHAAGEGAEVNLSLGGKSDGAPIAIRAKVERLSDGKFTCTGAMGAGNPADLGATALVRVADGVRVVVTSRKMQALDQALLRHVGIEPGEQKILALKSSVHFRADFQPIAEAVIVAVAPGPVTADPSGFPFKHLRKGIRLKPRAAG